MIRRPEPDEFLQKGADILTDYIIKLRKFLRKYPQPQPSAVHTGGDPDEELPALEESHMWEKLTPEEVIAEAILSNKMPEAQTFFRMHQHPAQSLPEFIQMGLNLVYDRLLKDNTREASELLRNMGFDVKEELRKICFYTLDKHVRDLLVKVLREENYFSEKEKKMIDFVHQVESFYSESFHENKEIQSLPRKGIFVSSELEDFELLLQRLSYLGGVLQNPHPVPNYSAASGLDFHARFVLHCLEHNLQYLLYTYLDYYSLTPSNCPILDKKDLHEAHPWFEFLVRCRGAAGDPQDASSDFPHFSSPELVNKYAIMERLDFLYYLHHGRPSFAFGTFLVQQLVKSKSPRQLIQQAGKEACVLALSFFSVPSVGAACVCFLELLGLDSLKLRVDIKVANIIFSYKTRNEESQHNQIKEALVEKLTKLADGEKAAAAEVLVALEEAFWDAVEHQGIKKTSSDSRRQWSLVMQFCQLHNIGLSTSYLKECAKSNDWLQFIIQTQLYSYQPAQIIPILQDFTPVLQDHLMLALEKLPGLCPGPGSAGSRAAAMAKGRNADGLFQILLQCQGNPDPSRHLLSEGLREHAPILSVLAACFQDANVIHCLCVWIITTADDATRAEATNHIQSSAENHDWDLRDLSVLWKVFLRKQKSKTLLNGFQLFLKDSPLLYILEMYELCMDWKKYNEAKTKLDKFQKSLTKVLRDLHHLRDIGQWHQNQTRIEFWKKCNDNFMKNSISSEAASGFFFNQANTVFESLAQEKITSIMERQLLLTLAGHWLAKSDSSSPHKLEEIEKQIWICRIARQTLATDEGSGKSRFSSHAAVKGDLTFDTLAEEFVFSKLPALNTPKYLKLEGLAFREPQQTLTSEEEESLRFLIGCLLDEGSVHEASRVCQYFHFYSRDVSLVLHCRALASGETELEKLHTDIQALLRGREKTCESSASQPGRVPSTSSLEDWTHLGALSPDDEVVTSLKVLIDECVHGRSYCRQVLCLYELSKVRLLTGIGRYNEMTYIFELLHEKHYFEVLMRKKLDPVGGKG
ncbi:spatacsin [Limosa lapponica baueri]|uniref:Spatacsin n=1 Tax=Limosa lapponica baueri TaxID=1758121 RepID=A0A2I0TEQ2_LIMLA|nr:spatacsin [Limosa lapponica baueri]